MTEAKLDERPGCLKTDHFNQSVLWLQTDGRNRHPYGKEPIMTQENHFDVIIIGTGAGGGTLAHRLAPSGKKILLLERLK